MHAIAYWGLLLALFAGLAGSGLACYQAWQGNESCRTWVERTQFAVVTFLVFCSAVLFKALSVRDFSFLYVAEYTDSFLPQFYALTAFWAGQDGSLLFWTVVISMAASVFPFTRSYRELPPRTRSLYWALVLLIQAFFILLMTNWSNPFRELVPVPADGRGLNPLLQNPGMIFHPPLLFLGYALFTIPACLALAAQVAGEKAQWLRYGRNWLITGWIFLTAGIILGGWWSYMELGWGGYWAWDPVENASLIPWLSSTALLHTAIIESRRGALRRTNVFLASLSLLLCFFATYLVRSGIIDSLHAFGEGGVALPLLVFMLSGLAVTLGAIGLGDGPDARPMDDFISRQGLLLIVSWLFLALGLVVMLGTMWPVISRMWSASPVGLDAGFYNRVCLPLFAVMALILAACPWLGWRGGLKSRPFALIALGALVGGAAGLYAWGMHLPVALLGGAAAVSAILSMLLLPAADPAMRRRGGLGFIGIHLGLALIVLGVAFSGPHQDSRELVLDKGQSFELKGYRFTYQGVTTTSGEAMAVAQATLTVEKDGKSVGTLTPERRLYRNFEQPFAEVSVIPSFGNELYATLMAFDRGGSASIKVSVVPLVNWLWIGGTLMCLAPFLVLRSLRARRDGDS